MNNIKFTGTISKPTLRYTPDAKPVWSGSVSLYTGGTQAAGYKPSVWIRVTAFDELAEALNNTITDKSRVTVTGQMQPIREYEKDGEKRQSIEVIAREVVTGDQFKPDDDVAF